MSTNQDSVFEQALSLPADVRANLIEKLLVSLNTPTQKEIDTLWAREVEHRVAQIENGEVELIPGEQVFFKIKDKYKK